MIRSYDLPWQWAMVIGSYFFSLIALLVIIICYLYSLNRVRTTLSLLCWIVSNNANSSLCSSCKIVSLDSYSTVPLLLHPRRFVFLSSCFSRIVFHLHVCPPWLLFCIMCQTQCILLTWISNHNTPIDFLFFACSYAFKWSLLQTATYQLMHITLLRELNFSNFLRTIN